jgi:hypothetical protein
MVFDRSYPYGWMTLTCRWSEVGLLLHPVGRTVASILALVGLLSWPTTYASKYKAREPCRLGGWVTGFESNACFLCNRWCFAR